MSEANAQWCCNAFPCPCWTPSDRSAFILTYSHCRLTPREFNSYGARRGNDDIMARGTFANIRLVNKLVSQAGPRTLHVPSGDEVGVKAVTVLLQPLVHEPPFE